MIAINVDGNNVIWKKVVRMTRDWQHKNKRIMVTSERKNYTYMSFFSILCILIFGIKKKKNGVAVT